MRRPLIAVLSVLVAATFAPGTRRHRLQKSAKTLNARQGASQEAGIGDGVHEIPAAEARRGRRVAYGAAQLLPRAGQVRDFVGGALRGAASRTPDRRIWRSRPARTESAFGYGTECGNDGWRISGVKWNCETAATGDETPSGEL